MIVLTRAGVCARLAGLGGPAWQCGVVFFTPRRPGPAVGPAGPGRQEDRRGRRIRMAGQNRAACQEAVRAPGGLQAASGFPAASAAGDSGRLSAWRTGTKRKNL